MTASTKRFWTGAGSGLLATLVMSAVMGIVWALGASPMPEPIPISFLARVVARALHLRTVSGGVIGLAIAIHLAYGAFWGGLLAVSTERVTWWKGITVGVGLWMIMIIFVLPLGGTDTFVVVTEPRTWVLTLLLHLVYGATLGVLVDRHHRVADELGGAGMA